MTHDTKRTRRAALSVAALAALLLAGCSSGNVGESWQCPLADAGTCESVAAADPAVPDPNAAWHTVLGEPLWREREGAGAAPPKADTACEAECAGFDPFAWLARLFDGETVDGNETAERGKPAAPGPVRLLPPEDTVSTTQSEAPAALPGEPDAPEIHPWGEEAAGGDLRTDEVVARIWIAPFVDAGGVYREASWVRVVLEPAGWRLGR